MTSAQSKRILPLLEKALVQIDRATHNLARCENLADEESLNHLAIGLHAINCDVLKGFDALRTLTAIAKANTDISPESAA